MVEIRLLGPLEVFDDDGAPVTVPGAKLRALLAALALRPGRVVSAERLVEELWGETATASAANSLQGLVSKLRRALPRGAVATRAPGYLLDLPVESVDVGRFERLAAEGRDALAGGDCQGATVSLREALGLWRGPALSEFVYQDFAQGDIVRLGEERAGVYEDCFDAELGCGGHAEVVAELEAAVAAEPLRERLRAQLMLALYRSGRQADALRQYQQARRVLGEELGLEPGPELRRLEVAMLAQDPGLDVAGKAPTPPKQAGRRSPRSRRSNIREPLTPTVGRTGEIAALTSLVGEHRLVTVIGPGGAGKTRLAVETARAVECSYRDGAWLVELAGLLDPDAVAPAVAAALGVLDLPGPAVSQDQTLRRLVDYLADREMLVVVDNCEHVVGEASRVIAELRGSCAGLHVLATSREGLGVPGERLWPAPPLAAGDAVALFVDRAAAAAPGFALTDDNRGLVADVCRRLDGLPLAIELAAARVRAFPVAQIAARLDDRFRLLSRGARTVQARQQTLRAVVDWSYDLLFEDERRLFERLSVFVAGCELRAVEAVCGDEQLLVDDIPDVLSRLVDKSLMVVDRRGDEARFSMLQTLAQYGRGRLEERGDGDELRARHGAWYAEVGRSTSIRAAGLPSWELSVSTEIDNLRAALDWAVATDNAEVALTIAAGLGGYWQGDGRPDEGLRWLEMAWGCAGTALPATLGLALLQQALLSTTAGRPDSHEQSIAAMRALFQDADAASASVAGVFLFEVAMARGDLDAAGDILDETRRGFAASSDNPFSAAGVAWFDGNAALLAGDHAQAETHFERAAQSFTMSKTVLGECAAREQVANFAEARGDYATARAALERVHSLAVDTRLQGLELTVLVRLANLAMLSDDPSRAESLYAEVYQLAADLAYKPVVVVALSNVAMRDRHFGRYDEAADAAQRALAVCQRGGRAHPTAGVLCILGFLAELRGDGQAAGDYHRQALAYAQQIDEPRAIAFALEGLAGVALLAGDGHGAARRLGAASRLRGRPGPSTEARAAVAGTRRAWAASGLEDRFDAERIEAAARLHLGPEAFEAAYAAGAAAGTDETISH